MSRFPGTRSIVGVATMPASQSGSGTVDYPATDFWTPQSIATDLVAWWDFLDLPNIQQEGDFIKSVADKSGHGLPLQQSDQTKRPRWVEHALGNSFEGGEYDGIDDRLTGSQSYPQPFTVVQFFKTGDTLQNYSACFGGAFASEALIYMVNPDAGGHLCMSAPNLVDSGTTLQPDTLYIIIAQFSDATSNVSINGAQYSTPNTGTFGINSGPNL